MLPGLMPRGAQPQVHVAGGSVTYGAGTHAFTTPYYNTFSIDFRAGGGGGGTIVRDFAGGLGLAYPGGNGGNTSWHNSHAHGGGGGTHAWYWTDGHTVLGNDGIAGANGGASGNGTGIAGGGAAGGAGAYYMERGGRGGNGGRITWTTTRFAGVLAVGWAGNVSVGGGGGPGGPAHGGLGGMYHEASGGNAGQATLSWS